MRDYLTDILEKNRAEKTTYADMINWCCDTCLLNNEIMRHFEYEVYCGCDYDEDTDEYEEVYQTYIIGDDDAERLKDYTNELVYYIEEIDMFLLGVTHFGTGWNGVPSNWKESITE